MEKSIGASSLAYLKLHLQTEWGQKPNQIGAPEWTLGNFQVIIMELEEGLMHLQQ